MNNVFASSSFCICSQKGSYVCSKNQDKNQSKASFDLLKTSWLSFYLLQKLWFSSTFLIHIAMISCCICPHLNVLNTCSMLLYLFLPHLFNKSDTYKRTIYLYQYDTNNSWEISRKDLFFTFLLGQCKW